MGGYLLIIAQKKSAIIGNYNKIAEYEMYVAKHYIHMKIITTYIYDN